MAYNRYVSKTTKKLGPENIRQKGTEVFRSTMPTKVFPADDDIIITPDDAQRFDWLAFEYYGSAALWWVIASVNNLTDGSMHVPPGTRVRIPRRSRVIG